MMTGGDAAEAEASILQIADALRDESRPPTLTEYGLASGSAGLAIFYHELHGTWPESRFLELRDRYWNEAIDGLESSNFARPNLYGGFTGVGWMSAYLSSFDEVTDAADETHEELEEALLERLSQVSDPQRRINDPLDYDLINGPTGWALYALERWPSQRATRALELIVDLFDKRAERIPEGVRWHTAPELLPDWQRENSPLGYYNLGLSHGMPGVWVLLAQTLAREIRPQASRVLLEDAVRWGLGQRLHGGTGLSFPATVDSSPRGLGTRLAWCYGDLGVAAALFVAGQVAGRKDWMQEACSVARHASTISQEVSRNVDAGLCHGAAGVGHIFNRFYQATGDEAFSIAGRYWFRIALDMRKEGIGPGGYAAWRHDPPSWVPTPGLLEGAAGIGLALLAAIGDREPSWDRFLSISPVPMPAASVRV